MQRDGRLQVAVAVLGTLLASAGPASAEESQPNPLSIGPAATSTLSELVVRERRTGPFDPDSELRLTGRQLRELGISHLAAALDLIPGVVIRAGGRGGQQADIRGARRGSVMVLVDGVQIQEPFFGNFDLSSIPSTDITEVRISQAPASPLDGPGGPGGVVEVLTRAAVGKPQAILRAEAADAPAARGSATVKTEIPFAAVRVSGGGAYDNRPFDVEDRDVKQDRRTAEGALLVERVSEHARLGGDLWVSHGHYFVPQNPESGIGAAYFVVDREDSFRGALLGELRGDGYKVSARGFAQLLLRDTLSYPRSLRDTPTPDLVDARRYGGVAQGTFVVLDELDVLGALHLIHEDASERFGAQPEVSSDATLLEAAAGARWRPLSWLAFDGAFGVAVPLSGGGLASPWPEARVSATASSTVVEVRLTGARKGRVPTLRELYSVEQSHDAVGPENSTFGEVQVVLRPLSWLALTGTGYVKTIEGFIRVDRATNRFGNIGSVFIPGVDLRLDLAPDGPFSAGVTYGLARPSSELLGEHPLDFFPDDRVDLWGAARWKNRLGAWARVRWEDDRWDNQGTVRLPGYTTVDATLWVSLDKTRILLRADNLLDRRYLARSTVPGDGRTLAVALEATLD